MRHYNDEYVWLKWFRMTYTIVTFTGYLGFVMIAAFMSLLIV